MACLIGLIIDHITDQALLAERQKETNHKGKAGNTF